MASLEDTPRQTQGGGGIISPISPLNAVVFSLRSWGGGSGENGPGILSDIAAPTIRALICRAKWR